MKIHIEGTNSITADENGAIIHSGETVITLTWEAIDKIAYVTEPHYFAQAVSEVAIMNSQKKIN